MVASSEITKQSKPPRIGSLPVGEIGRAYQRRPWRIDHFASVDPGINPADLAAGGELAVHRDLSPIPSASRQASAAAMMLAADARTQAPS